MGLSASKTDEKRQYTDKKRIAPASVSPTIASTTTTRAVPPPADDAYDSDDSEQEKFTRSRAPPSRKEKSSAGVKVQPRPTARSPVWGEQNIRARSVSPDAPPAGWKRGLGEAASDDDEPRLPTSSQQPAVSSLRYQLFYNQELGSGGYGTVYKAFDKFTGEFVAVKETRIAQATQPDRLRDALRSEFETLTQLRHPHIVKVLDFSCDDGKSQIFMEWLPSGSVSHILRGTGFRFHERVIRRYTAEALRGLAYLHSQGILHRDIKSGNMLVTGTGVVKLSDFGTSKTVTQTSVPSTAQIVGTPSYMSKEAIALGKYSTASDVWAMACSVVEMASGRPPWSELPLPQQAPIPLMFRIGNAVPPDHHPAIPPHLSDELKALLARMFDVDADRRPSAEALLADLYFSGDAAKPLPHSAESSEAFEAALRESLQKRQQSTSSVTVSSAWLMTGSSSDFIINRGPSSDGVVPASNQSTRS